MSKPLAMHPLGMGEDNITISQGAGLPSSSLGHNSEMSFLPFDPLNREIIALSLGLQREISKQDGPGGPMIGAQQVMPRPEHVNHFGPQNPLPWVPDRVGTEFSLKNDGVLVVGSSYNGFIEGYCRRSMKLADYLQARDLIRDGNEDPAHLKVEEACTNFIRAFEAQVMAPDTSTYYGPILNGLLGQAGVLVSRVCLTDLCKASFVQRGLEREGHPREDVGHDGIVRKNWDLWIKFLTCRRTMGEPPLPYQWIWKRMQQCRHIVALGTIAEYGLLKIFHHMAGLPKIDKRNGGKTCPDQSLAPKASWKYCYADPNRKLSHWLRSRDWWILSDGLTGKKWNLLPVYHPAARLPYADPGYAQSSPILQEMLSRQGRTGQPQMRA